MQLAGWKKHDVLANCHWIGKQKALCCHNRLSFLAVSHSVHSGGKKTEKRRAVRSS